MRARDATVLGLVVSSLAAPALGCRAGDRAGAPPAGAGALVTVYIAPRLADRLMGRLQTVAARHQWALSVRTDEAAVTEADLVITESGGALAERVRPGSAVAAQARELADAVRP